jgi:hypothetical protein
MTWRAWVVLAAAVTTVSCAAPLLKLPPPGGAPASDASAALAEALATCHGVRTLTAQMAVSGKVNGQRVRARLQVGLAEPASAYIEAPAPFGAPVFVFAAQNDEATLLLPRDRRVLEHGRPADVLEAIAGVPLAPAALRAAVTGCLESTEPRTTATQPSALWRIFPGDPEAYVHRDRDADPWQLVAVVHHGAGPAWRAEYHDFVSKLPRSIHLTSAPSSRFDLQLTLSDVEVNVPIESTTFRVQIPAGTAPLTLDELKSAGPLADRSRKSDE